MSHGKLKCKLFPFSSGTDRTDEDCYYFLPLTTLLKLLTFPFGYLIAIPTVSLLLGLFLDADMSICSTVVFRPLVIVIMMLKCLLNFF